MDGATPPAEELGLLEALRTTPATREFTTEPVDDATLTRVLDAARFAPSGGNRQPWHVIVVRDRALRAQLRDLATLGWREYAAYTGQGRVPFAPGEDGRWAGPIDGLAEARGVDVPNPLLDDLVDVPVLLLVLADLTQLAVLDNGLDRQSIVGGGSVYPFVHNLLLAARAEGLGAVMTTFLCREEPAVRELLGFPQRFALASMVAMGQPSRRVTRLRRRPVAEFTTVDRWDGPAFGG